MENKNQTIGNDEDFSIQETESENTEEMSFSEWCDIKQPFDEEASRITGERRAKERTAELQQSLELNNMQRMDSLVSIGDHSKITIASQQMILTLKREGFEAEEIYNYICSIVQEAGN